MEKVFVLCVLGAFFLGAFCVSLILSSVLRIEKHLKSISEDLRILSLLKK